jgi:hypothetical protein
MVKRGLAGENKKKKQQKDVATCASRNSLRACTCTRYNMTKLSSPAQG